MTEKVSSQHLGAGAFTGSVEQGNPYKGNLEECISYDRFDCGFTTLEQEGGDPHLVTNYLANVRKLLQHLSVKPGYKILELGSGTGITTIELFEQHPDVNIICVEESPGMLEIARYKFGISDGEDLLKMVSDQRLLDYWSKQRSKAIPHKGKVEFVLGDFQESDLEEESFDAAIATQFMHWTDLSRSFGRLRESLKLGAECVWNSASHFYEDATFPIAVYGFRYNVFLELVLEEIGRRGVRMKNLRDLFRPKHDIGTIQRISESQGFGTKQVGVQLLPIDLQILLEFYAPSMVRAAIDQEVEGEEMAVLYNEAVAKTITNPNALQDMDHKFEIIPIFVSTKK